VNALHKYWRVYDEALESLRGKDLAERCAAAGFRYDPGGIEIPFFDRMYSLSVRAPQLAVRISAPDCPEESVATADAGSLPLELQEKHLRDRILILHYLDRASGAELSGTMIGFDQLAGGRFYGSAFRGRVELPLVRAFASSPKRLVEIAQRLGGAPAAYGDCSVLLHPFPRVPLVIILWQSDEEVPANGKVLWDAAAEDYLCVEDLTVLGETVVQKFKALAVQQPVLGAMQQPVLGAMQQPAR
jgi:hypothetical protein